jgi:hypothetical protein
MREQNGVRIYSKGEKITGVPENLASVDFTHIHSPYGLKLVNVQGELKWLVASEVDYRRSEAQRLGIKPSEVKERSGGCRQTTPVSCSGTCIDKSECKLLVCHGEHGDSYYCSCV